MAGIFFDVFFEKYIADSKKNMYLCIIKTNKTKEDKMKANEKSRKSFFSNAEALQWIEKQQEWFENDHEEQRGETRLVKGVADCDAYQCPEELSGWGGQVNAFYLYDNNGNEIAAAAYWTEAWAKVMEIKHLPSSAEVYYEGNSGGGVYTIDLDDMSGEFDESDIMEFIKRDMERFEQDTDLSLQNKEFFRKRMEFIYTSLL